MSKIRHKPTIEELKNGFGRIVEFTWGHRGRIIQACNTYITIDFPDKRCYFDNGNLSPMPTKKIYFNTTNPVWTVQAIIGFNDGYKFKLKEFKPGILVVNPSNIKPNVLLPLFRK